MFESILAYHQKQGCERTGVNWISQLRLFRGPSENKCLWSDGSDVTDIRLLVSFSLLADTISFRWCSEGHTKAAALNWFQHIWPAQILLQWRCSTAATTGFCWRFWGSRVQVEFQQSETSLKAACKLLYPINGPLWGWWHCGPLFNTVLTVGLYVSKCQAVKEISKRKKDCHNKRSPLVYPDTLQGVHGRAACGCMSACSSATLKEDTSRTSRFRSQGEKNSRKEQVFLARRAEVIEGR